MNTQTQTPQAPVMVELKPDQIIMDKQDVRDILESHLSISQGNPGKSPDQVYADKLNDFSLGRHKNPDSAFKSLERLNRMRKDVRLLNMYFDNFVIEGLQEQVEHEVSAHEHEVALANQLEEFRMNFPKS